MNPFRVWRHPLAVTEQAAGLVALGALWYWWLGIAESSTGQLLLSFVVLLAIAASVLLLILRGRRRLATQPGSTGESLAALLFFAMSLAAAYLLIWWVPPVSSLRGQIASAVLRFAAAFALVVTFWANLLGALARRMPPIEESSADELA